MGEIVQLRKTGRTVTLSSEHDGPGPWRTVITGAPHPGYWYIFNCITQNFKRIGPVGSQRVNYYELAHQEARKRNAEHILRKAGG